jgi:hypothetical protein
MRLVGVGAPLQPRLQRRWLRLGTKMVTNRHTVLLRVANYLWLNFVVKGRLYELFS